MDLVLPVISYAAIKFYDRFADIVIAILNADIFANSTAKRDK